MEINFAFYGVPLQMYIHTHPLNFIGCLILFGDILQFRPYAILQIYNTYTKHIPSHCIQNFAAMFVDLIVPVGTHLHMYVFIYNIYIKKIIKERKKSKGGIKITRNKLQHRKEIMNINYRNTFARKKEECTDSPIKNNDSFKLIIFLLPFVDLST